jgi:hypothetical protein
LKFTDQRGRRCEIGGLESKSESKIKSKKPEVIPDSAAVVRQPNDKRGLKTIFRGSDGLQTWSRVCLHQRLRLHFSSRRLGWAAIWAVAVSAVAGSFSEYKTSPPAGVWANPVTTPGLLVCNRLSSVDYHSPHVWPSDRPCHSARRLADWSAGLQTGFRTVRFTPAPSHERQTQLELAASLHHR